MHWANNLIGKPWVSGAQGPDAFDCWGLVRFCLRNHFGIEVPELVADVPAAARAAGWRSVDGRVPLNGDVVLMWDGVGQRHVGLVLVGALGVPSVLHAVEGVGVGLDPMRHLPALQYRDITSWRLL